MIELNFEKVYSTDRINENCSIGLPFPKGELFDTDRVVVKNAAGEPALTQSRACAYWQDGSIKWLFIRFEATILANRSAKYYVDICDKADVHTGIKFAENVIENGVLRAALSEDKNKIFDYIEYGGISYNSLISSPLLKDDSGNEYDFKINGWDIVEEGFLCTVVKGRGSFTLQDREVYSGEINLIFYKDKPEIELGCKIINTSDDTLNVGSLVIESRKAAKGNVRCTAAYSNYKTSYDISCDGSEVYQYVDAHRLKYESNEHNAEVFYGTFFGDYTDEEIGICASVYQAQQNFPKAVRVSKSKMEIMLVPQDIGNVRLMSGMAREQRILFCLHGSDEPMENINNRTIIYQMPDKPTPSPDVFERAGVFTNLFVKDKNYDMELFIEAKADEHSRCYGMMNWGDSPDVGYTNQGRGGGKLVWTNNEYDFPHACALQYARTGTRRFLDYLLVSAKHWIDVDICHYSNDPLKLGGQYEHTNDHIAGGNIVCSHQWVEGLLDYYHFSGDIEGYTTAVGIGENILRLLETPMFDKPGEANARETGWALRSLTALYVETNDEKWLEKCDWIVGHFRQWREKYGLWLAPYTDNSVIRIPFMISVAVGSLMRYYRVRKSDEIKEMILAAVDDLCENARFENGLFYYKELPSLKRTGNNPLILEALSIAYELSGDKKYIEYGLPTLKYVMSFKPAGVSFNKRIEEDALIQGNMGTKSFAQLMIPVTLFYKYARELNIL